jgi:hypothetical protein
MSSYFKNKQKIASVVKYHIILKYRFVNSAKHMHFFSLLDPPKRKSEVF